MHQVYPVGKPMAPAASASRGFQEQSLLRSSSRGPCPLLRELASRSSGYTKVHSSIYIMNNHNLLNNHSSFNSQQLILHLHSPIKQDVIDSLDLVIQFIEHLNSLIMERFCESTYNQVASKLIRNVAIVHNFSHHKVIKQRMTTFTMTRSAFIFKKTREQYGLKNNKCMITFQSNRMQQELLLQYISTLKLPAELTIICIS